MHWLSWYKTKTCRMVSMLCLTFSFFLCEIIFGYITNSLALIGDSYHMLSDVMALIVGLTSLRVSKKNSQKNTYGWARAEVLGALVNSVFLIALCFTIFLEAIQRLTHPHKIEQVDNMIYVGVAGLVVNILGLILFCGQGQSKEDREHQFEDIIITQHSAQGSTESTDSTKSVDSVEDTSTSAENTAVSSMNGGPTFVSIEIPESSTDTSTTSSQLQTPDEPSDDTAANKPKKIKSAAQLNMRAVFLHVLGDALGSVVVIISAILIKFLETDWKYKIDPVLSLVLVCIIICTSSQLLKESALILMQTVPTHIKVAELKKKILEKVEGVYDIHEFHVWQLAGNRIIATAHIHCRSLDDYARIAGQIKSLFHNEGIHSTTIQPEFVEFPELLANRACILECGPDKACYMDTCCARRKSAVEPSSDVDVAGIRRSSKRVPSWLDIHNSDTRSDRQLTDIISTFIRHKRQKRQTDDTEFGADAAVETPDTKV